VRESVAGVEVWGHPRRGWEPTALDDKPLRGAFVVSVVSASGEVAVAETGPEARPFPALRSLDLDAVADDAIAALA